MHLKYPPDQFLLNFGQLHVLDDLHILSEIEYAERYALLLVINTTSGHFYRMQMSFGVYMQDNQQENLQIPSLLNLQFMFVSYAHKEQQPPPPKKTHLIFIF